MQVKIAPILAADKKGQLAHAFYCEKTNRLAQSCPVRLEQLTGMEQDHGPH